MLLASSNKINSLQSHPTPIKADINQSKNEKNANRAIELIFNNKVNAKNAFEVNVDFLETIPAFVNEKEENSWQKVSASLDASSRIYGFRVDSTHNDTFRFLSGLSRNKQKEDEDKFDKAEEKKSSDERDEANFINAHIEEDKEKLILKKCDMDTKVDPIFIQMSTMFSGAGAKGFLLNSLTVDDYLDILLEEKNEKCTENKQLVNRTANEQFNELDTIVNDYIVHMIELKKEDNNESELVPGLSAFKQQGTEKKCDLEDYEYLQNLIFKAKDINTDTNMHITEEPIIILEEEVKSIDEPVSENDIFDIGAYQLNSDKELNDNEANDNIDLINYDANAFLPGFDPVLLESMGKESVHKLLNQKTYLNSLPILTNPVKKRKLAKESIPFKFSELFSVNRDEIFDSKRKTLIKKRPQHNKTDILNNPFLFRNGKVYQIKENLFHPFLSRNLKEEKKRSQQDIAINSNNTKEENDAPEKFFSQNDNENEDERNVNQPIVNKAIIDKAYLEHYGSMYKTFDMKYLKKILYSTYLSIMSDCPVYFKALYQKFITSIDEVTARNISPQIIFSIMLILASEKSIEVVQLEDSDDILLSSSSSNSISNNINIDK